MEEITLSRMDKLGLQFMEDPDKVSDVESFELLADLFGVEERDLFDHLHGKEFRPVEKDA